MMKPMTLSLKTLEPYLAILVAALPVLVIGATFGWGLNHSTYLVEGIKIAHPEIWQNDWWVNETTHYHFLFSYLVYGLEKLAILKPALVVANILVIFASFYLIYRIIREVYGPRTATRPSIKSGGWKNTTGFLVLLFLNILPICHQLLPGLRFF